MNITGEIFLICDEMGFFYSEETPSMENVRQDKTKHDVIMWRNIVEDGSFEENIHGLFCIRRHFQFGIYQDCKLGERGHVLNNQKEFLLSEMLKFWRKLSKKLSDESWEQYQPASFQVGYDKNDANKAFCLIDVYFKSPFSNECI